MEISRLLSNLHFKLATIEEARKKFARELAPDFCIFDYLRSDETGLSRCLATLLDPAASHAQGAIYLNEFLKLIKLDGLLLSETACCSVLLERQIENQRRIDIVLESDTFLIGIENKPWARDQEKQLQDYAHHLHTWAGDSKKWLLIYFCNLGPSESSIDQQRRKDLEQGGNFQAVSFYQIKSWLRTCAEKTRVLHVRVFIEELEKFVRSKINGEENMSEQMEIQTAVCASRESMDTAIRLANAMPTLRLALLEKLHQDLSAASADEPWNLEWSLNSTGRYAGFGVRFSAHQKVFLSFNFEFTNYRGFFWGLSKDDAKYENKKKWSKINALMNDAFSSQVEWPWWPWSSAIPDKFFDQPEFKNWDVNVLPWWMIQEGTLVPKIVQVIHSVYEVFKDDMALLE